MGDLSYLVEIGIEMLQGLGVLLNSCILVSLLSIIGLKKTHTKKNRNRANNDKLWKERTVNRNSFNINRW